MREHGVDAPDQVRALGAIDLPTIQRYLNFHYSVTLDLFGADQSSNAAMFFSSGLKGRYEEARRGDDHVLKDRSHTILDVQHGKLVEREAPMLNALNEVLRDDFIRDSISGVGRWNKIIEKAGLPYRLAVPHKAFNRQIGTLSGVRVTPDGRVVSQAEWDAQVGEWMPTAADREFVGSLMRRVLEPGRYAGWIAPPTHRINKQPLDMEYVKLQ
jgi:benzoyl-CoA 2,3-dioxygenase component B